MSELEITSRPSPNRDERTSGVDMLVLHYTGMTSAEAALERMCDPEAKVSAHYMIDEDGSVVQMVDEKERAWHAGVSFWKGQTDINSRSVGIEIVNPGHEFGYTSFPPEQMEAVLRIAAKVVEYHGIKPSRVLGHSDVAPQRKQDPGEKFDWSLLAEHGIGLWPFEKPALGLSEGPFLAFGDEGEPVAAIQKLLHEYGYEIEINGEMDQQTVNVVAAFQRHFRPVRVDARIDTETAERIVALTEALKAGYV